MLNTIINSADNIRAKYKLEIDCTLDKVAFFKAKFRKDRAQTNYIAKSLFKKIK